MFWLNLKQIRHTQVRDEGLTRQKMERDYNDPGSIRAEDIPYDANLSTKQVVQNLGEAAINPFNVSEILKSSVRPIFSGSQNFVSTNLAQYITTTSPAVNITNQVLELAPVTANPASIVIDVEDIYGRDVSLTSEQKSNFLQFLDGTYAGGGSKLLIIARVASNVLDIDTNTNNGFVVEFQDNRAGTAGATYKVANKLRSGTADTWQYITAELFADADVNIDTNFSAGAGSRLSDVKRIKILSTASGASATVQIAFIGIIKSGALLGRKVFSNGTLKVIEECTSVTDWNNDTGLTSITKSTGDYVYFGASIQLASDGATDPFLARRVFSAPVNLFGFRSIFVWVKFPSTHNFASISIGLTNEASTYSGATNKIKFTATTTSDGSSSPGVGWNLFKFDLAGTPTDYAGNFNFQNIQALTFEYNFTSPTAQDFLIGLIYVAAGSQDALNATTGILTFNNANALTQFGVDGLQDYQIRFLNPVNRNSTAYKLDGSTYDITANTVGTLTVNNQRVTNPNISVGGGGRLSGTNNLVDIAAYDSSMVEIYDLGNSQATGNSRSHIAAIPQVLNGELIFALGLLDVISGGTNLIDLGQHYSELIEFSARTPYRASGSASFQFFRQDANNYLELAFVTVGTGGGNYTRILELKQVLAGVPSVVGIISPNSLLAVNGTDTYVDFGAIQILNKSDKMQISRDGQILLTFSTIWESGAARITASDMSLILLGLQFLPSYQSDLAEKLSNQTEIEVIEDYLNLSKNPSFEDWSNYYFDSGVGGAKAHFIPDSWSLAETGVGGTISRSTSNRSRGAYSYQVTKSAGAGSIVLYQSIDTTDKYFIPQTGNRTFFASVQAYSSVLGSAKISIYNGATEIATATNKRINSLELIQIKTEVASTVTDLRVRVEVNHADAVTAYLSSVTFYEGKKSKVWVPSINNQLGLYSLKSTGLYNLVENSNFEKWANGFTFSSPSATNYDSQVQGPNEWFIVRSGSGVDTVSSDYTETWRRGPFTAKIQVASGTTTEKVALLQELDLHTITFTGDVASASNNITNISAADQALLNALPSLTNLRIYHSAFGASGSPKYATSLGGSTLTCGAPAASTSATGQTITGKFVGYRFLPRSGTKRFYFRVKVTCDQVGKFSVVFSQNTDLSSPIAQFFNTTTSAGEVIEGFVDVGAISLGQRLFFGLQVNRDASATTNAYPSEVSLFESSVKLGWISSPIDLAGYLF